MGAGQAEDHDGVPIVENVNGVTEHGLHVDRQRLRAIRHVLPVQREAPQEGGGVDEVQPFGRPRGANRPVVVGERTRSTSSRLEVKERVVPPIVDGEKAGRPVGRRGIQEGHAFRLSPLHLEHVGQCMAGPDVAGLLLQGRPGGDLGPLVVAVLLQAERRTCPGCSPIPPGPRATLRRPSRQTPLMSLLCPRKKYRSWATLSARRSRESWSRARSKKCVASSQWP